MTCLDERALEAAREQPGTNHDGIIRAYLSTITPAEAGGLVERLKGSHSNWSLGGKGPAILIEAATALTSLAARVEVLEAGKTVADALHDSAYLAGAKAGWNAAQADNPNGAFEQLMKSRQGYLKPITDRARRVREGGKVDG